MIATLGAASWSVAAPPPAWRALQGSHLPDGMTERGRLRGAPPCLKTLRKVGQGHDAAWRLGTFQADGLDLEINVALDKNPAEPCCKLQFLAPHVGTVGDDHDGLRARRRKAGHMLLASGEDESALRGMRIVEDLRGRGLSKVLLAVWLRMCLDARVVPRTREINKPLLSLSLSRFGFGPTNNRGQVVAISSATRLRDCRARDFRGYVAGRTAYVRTAFEPPRDTAALDAAVESVLCDGLRLEASPEELRRALTLRGGAMRRQPSRRTAIASAGALSSTLLRAQPERALAVDSATSTLSLADKFARSAALAQDDRMPISLALRPSYGIEMPDVAYPPYALGRWTVTSTLRSVYAPAGEALFAPGRNGTEALRRARTAEPPLVYENRWRRERGEPGPAVLDRGYNVASISRASMGSSAVQNVQEDGPNHRTIVLRPAGAPPGALYSADLRVVARRADPYPFEEERPALFACAETTRQTVTTIAGEKVQGSPPRAPLIKEVETICTYALDPSNADVMRGGQRTATFLVPDAAYTGDPSLAEMAASRLTRAPNGQLVAVDVRVYDLVYTRVAA